MKRLVLATSTICLVFAGCGRKTETGSSTLGSGNAESTHADEEEPGYYLSDEEILEEEATPGQRVAVIFFGGGSPSKCINWDLKISGDENIKLVKPKRNEARHLDSVLQNDDGSVSALFKSVGGKDGIKMLVKDGDTFVVEGKARNCDNSESREVEYETKVITKAKIKIWTGDRKDEVGKSVLKLRISTLKRGEKVAAKLEKKEEKAEEKSEKKTEKEEKKAAKKN